MFAQRTIANYDDKIPALMVMICTNSGWLTNSIWLLPYLPFLFIPHQKHPTVILTGDRRFHLIIISCLNMLRWLSGLMYDDA